jgi:hypothetical protein
MLRCLTQDILEIVKSRSEERNQRIQGAVEFKIDGDFSRVVDVFELSSDEVYFYQLVCSPRRHTSLQFRRNDYVAERKVGHEVAIILGVEAVQVCLLPK